MAFFDKVRNRRVATPISRELALTTVDQDYTDSAVPADPHGPLYGPIAQGLALSGPMSLPTDTPWNALAQVGGIGGWVDGEAMLAEYFAVTNADGWTEGLDSLLNGVGVDDAAHQSVDIRTAAKRKHAAQFVDDAEWARALRTEADRLGMAQDQADALTASIPRVRAAEDLLRETRLLEDGEEVDSLHCWPYAYLCNVARWGVTAGWGPPSIVSDVALRAHDHVQHYHSSWRSYALAVGAGIIVNLPDTAPGELIINLGQIRHFLESRHSPWNNVPFPTEPARSAH